MGNTVTLRLITSWKKHNGVIPTTLLPTLSWINLVPRIYTASLVPRIITASFDQLNSCECPGLHQVSSFSMWKRNVYLIIIFIVHEYFPAKQRGCNCLLLPAAMISTPCAPHYQDTTTIYLCYQRRVF